MSDLTSSKHQRQNILNNRYAMEAAEQNLALGGVSYKGETVFTKQQVMGLFDISDATVERYIAANAEELRANGYSLIRGKSLNDFKELVDGTLINEGTKTSVLGLFNFRAVLNLAMLLTESEGAKEVRARLLDIVIDVLAERSGGHTKYINQRDDQYLIASFQEESYRKQFTDALDKWVVDHKWKYVRFTNLIYLSIFKENASEYRKVLNLKAKDNVRETMYSEVLNLIASYENGVPYELEKASRQLERKLTMQEAETLFAEFESHPLFVPLILEARTKMASRDLGFRDALHHKLEMYINSIPSADFDRFLGETSKSLEERLSDPETLAVFQRLKDR
jgi:predicted nucleic acid-binding protein